MKTKNEEGCTAISNNNILTEQMRGREESEKQERCPVWIPLIVLHEETSEIDLPMLGLRQGVKLIFTGGHISLAVASKGRM